MWREQWARIGTGARSESLSNAARGAVGVPRKSARVSACRRYSTRRLGVASYWRCARSPVVLHNPTRRTARAAAGFTIRRVHAVTRATWHRRGAGRPGRARGYYRARRGGTYWRSDPRPSPTTRRLRPDVASHSGDPGRRVLVARRARSDVEGGSGRVRPRFLIGVDSAPLASVVTRSLRSRI